MTSGGLGAAQQTILPQEIVNAVENSDFWDQIPLWAVTLIGSLFIVILSFIMIMTVYGVFQLYLYTAIAPVPLSTFAENLRSMLERVFIKSYAAVCLEGAIIVLGCIIFSLFAASPPAISPKCGGCNTGMELRRGVDFLICLF